MCGCSLTGGPLHHKSCRLVKLAQVKVLLGRYLKLNDQSSAALRGQVIAEWRALHNYQCSWIATQKELVTMKALSQVRDRTLFGDPVRQCEFTQASRN